MGIKWRRQSREQLLDILKYIRQEFGPLVAKDISRKIRESVDNLQTFPGTGVRDERFEVEVRKLTVKLSVVYYLIENNTINILAVLDSRRSPDRIHNLILKEIKE